MLTKTSLRDQVKDYLQEQMLLGKIEVGGRISLPSLAKDLGVSVTPIRESLSQLQQVNLVEAIPNRGFFLSPLSKREALEVYPIIAQLEAMGIMQSAYSAKDLSELAKIQVGGEKAKSTQAILQSDIKFHERLLANCQNEHLKRIINDLKIRVYLYEFYFMQEPDLAQGSAENHKQIIEALKNKDNTKAADLVKESWHKSEPFIHSRFPDE